MILWGIWNPINEISWNNNTRSTTQIVRGALELHGDWVKELQFVAQKPPLDFLKCNTDAATFENNSSIGLPLSFKTLTESL
ncbi:hypothetical protein Ccrd_021572 [Cynara cardunculus var. scolymus]|uniref:Uncharacterized protein n=1 Tax=Cynara cardunculus var. scolymus TaxID=59895 RepID=A0A103Y0B2_CYNCS|nr:hypothetical protein Ccrd_021572 [Cynara cardunculus var. scolymus]